MSALRWATTNRCCYRCKILQPLDDFNDAPSFHTFLFVLFTSHWENCLLFGDDIVCYHDEIKSTTEGALIIDRVLRTGNPLKLGRSAHGVLLSSLKGRQNSSQKLAIFSQHFLHSHFEGRGSRIYKIIIIITGTVVTAKTVSRIYYVPWGH